MNTILFLHDTALETPRGAELTINELILFGKKKGYATKIDVLKDFELTKNNIKEASLVVVNNTSRCDFEQNLINHLLKQKVTYIKVEYDYNFCIRRNILCTVDPKVKSCCDSDKFHLFRRLFAGSKLTIFQSPKHHQAHYSFYGEALGNFLIIPPSGRLAAEAFLSGCEMITNDKVGTFSFDFYPDDKEKAISEMKQAPENFWTEIENILIGENVKVKTPKLGNVLVYKSYGGLGDIFFAIPAIYKLAKVSKSLQFAVAPRLVDFFTKYLKEVTVVNEEEVRDQEANYDTIYELGNYPAFRGYDLPHALKYPTHKKVKQHAIQHYIDTIAKLHIKIDNQLERYPYFKRHLDAKNKYFVIHPGAGFLLKIWPTDKFAQLIECLHNLFPNLNCKIIQGPNDPDISTYFTKKMKHIEYIKGGMIEVGKVMEGALFHIGNDAGITHVAGSFNVPSVGIYGPTGPGSWGSFAENNQLIWGKKGVCNIKCNYDVIINCEHHICLNSITVNRVIEALYIVLQKAYPNKKAVLKVNPQVKSEFSAKDCLIKLNDSELLLEYHTPTMRRKVEALLKDEYTDSKDADFLQVIHVLKQQLIIFKIPVFDS